MAMKKYFWNILVAIDQLVNALFAGYPDETISSRSAKAKAHNKTWGRVMCKFLNFFDKCHCEKSVERDEGKPL